MLYGVVGDGTGNKTEILQTLEDLKEKAQADDLDFWFVLLAKETLTTTDKAILKWLQDSEVWYEVIGDADEEVYLGAQAVHGAKDPYRKVLAMLTEKAPQEGAILLALYVDSEGEDEADNELAMLTERAVEDDVEVRLLNGQMIRLTFTEDEEPSEVDEDDAVPEDEEPLTFSESELRSKRVAELRAIARSQGIEGKELGKNDLVVALMEKFDGDAPAPAPARGASKKSSAAAARAALAAVPDEEEADEDEIDAASIAASTLDSRDNSKVHAAIVVFVDGAVTMLPVSIGHARAVLAGKGA